MFLPFIGFAMVLSLVVRKARQEVRNTRAERT